jgi:hypothetical protein
VNQRDVRGFAGDSAVVVGIEAVVNLQRIGVAAGFETDRLDVEGTAVRFKQRRS